MIVLQDVSDSDPNTILHMEIVREYSSQINKRMTSGPMGKGWIVPTLYVLMLVNIKLMFLKINAIYLYIS